MEGTKSYSIPLGSKLADAKEKLVRLFGPDKNVVGLGMMPGLSQYATFDTSYCVAEQMVDCLLATVERVLSRLGVSAEDLVHLGKWAKTGSVMLSLEAMETCTYVKEEVTEVETAVERHREYGLGFLGTTAKRVDKVITKVHEHVWAYKVEYKVCLEQLVMGEGEGKRVLKTAECTTEVRTSTKEHPHKERSVLDPIELRLNDLLDLLGGRPFCVDRDRTECRTPRRNPEVELVLKAALSLSAWASRTFDFFRNHVGHKSPKRELSALADINVLQLFLPQLPLVRVGGGRLTASELGELLAEQDRTVNAKIADLAKVFAGDDRLVGLREAELALLLLQLGMAAHNFATSLQYLEDLLESHLIDALGRAVDEVDLFDLARFHFSKTLQPAYRPPHLCYPVRTGLQDPEGLVTLEWVWADGERRPVNGLTVASPGHSTSLPLSSAAQVTLRGPMFLHTVMAQAFGEADVPALNIGARARPFSSYILLLGRIPAEGEFQCEAALLIRNSDDVTIPMMVETIPSAKEFKERIQSISDTQQRFAKQYRSMQMSSTLFAMATIPIRPQLERLLRVPEGGFLKEIALVEEILDLLVEYSIPSDLLKYDGSPEDDGALLAVKENVYNMIRFVETTKALEQLESLDRAALRSCRSGTTLVVYVHALNKPPVKLYVEPFYTAHDVSLLYGEKDAETQSLPPEFRLVTYNRRTLGVNERLDGAGIADGAYLLIGQQFRETLLGYSTTDSDLSSIISSEDEESACSDSDEGEVCFKRDDDADMFEDLNYVKEAMFTNLDKCADRSERLEDLDMESEDDLLGDIEAAQEELIEAKQFQKKSKSLFKAKTPRKMKKDKRKQKDVTLKNEKSKARERSSAVAKGRRSISRRHSTKTKEDAECEEESNSRRSSARKEADESASNEPVTEAEEAEDAPAGEEGGEDGLTDAPTDEAPKEGEEDIPAAEDGTEDGHGTMQLPAASESVDRALDSLPLNAPVVPVREHFDVTTIPQKLEQTFERLSVAGEVRPGILRLGGDFSKRYKPSLLANVRAMVLGTEDQKEEKNKAYDLLDSLSRSGSLPVGNVELHTVVVNVHCFSKTLMKVLVADSVNPIEHIEQSVLGMAAVTFDCDPEDVRAE